MDNNISPRFYVVVSSWSTMTNPTTSEPMPYPQAKECREQCLEMSICEDSRIYEV